MFISTYTKPAHEQFLSGVTSSDVHRGLAGSRKMRHQPGGTCNELASALLSKGAAATELQPAGGCSCGNKAPCQHLPLFKRSKNYIFFFNVQSLQLYMLTTNFKKILIRSNTSSMNRIWLEFYPLSVCALSNKCAKWS